MESSNSRAEIMKPVLIKVGIPLALSVAAFVCARIVARRSVPQESISENHVDSLETNSQHGSENSFCSLDSSCMPSMEHEERLIEDRKPELENELLGMRSRIEELQKRELDLEMSFIRYQDLKEQESVLLQLRNMLLLERAQTEFLDREISYMEEESKRLEKLVVEYLRVLEQLQYWKSESGLLQRKVKKLLRRMKVQSSIIREKDLKIEAREEEILRTHEALETRTYVVKKLEDEVGELKMSLDHQQEEKNELLKKLELAEKSASSISKIEAEGTTMEDLNWVANELEQLQKERAAEVKELIHLRWSNACLRHELMKNQEHEKDQNRNQNQSELDLEGNLELGNCGFESELENSVVLGHENGDQTSKRKKKFVHRLKKWVEGSEKGKGKVDEKERNEGKWFGRHSVLDEAEENLQASTPCSSASSCTI
ncbi:hypothetical protein UlMin_005668 [Ulmus minor]